MCDLHGGGEGCCEPEDLTVDDLKALLEERKKILEAKLATVEHMLKSLDKKSDSDK